MWGCMAYSAITSLAEADVMLAFEYYRSSTADARHWDRRMLAELLVMIVYCRAAMRWAQRASSPASKGSLKSSMMNLYLAEIYVCCYTSTK